MKAGISPYSKNPFLGFNAELSYLVFPFVLFIFNLDVTGICRCDNYNGKCESVLEPGMLQSCPDFLSVLIYSLLLKTFTE